MTVNDTGAPTTGPAAGGTDSGADPTETPGGDPAAVDDDHDDHPDDEQDDDDLDTGENAPNGRRNREAHYRRRARAAEAERDTLRAQLDALHQDTVNEVAASAGLPDSALLGAAGYELSGFLDEDGKIDRSKVRESATAAMVRFGVTPKRFGIIPNPQQGAHGGQMASKGLAKVIGDALES